MLHNLFKKSKLPKLRCRQLDCGICDAQLLSEFDLLNHLPICTTLRHDMRRSSCEPKGYVSTGVEQSWSAHVTQSPCKNTFSLALRQPALTGHLRKAVQVCEQSRPQEIV